MKIERVVDGAANSVKSSGTSSSVKWDYQQDSSEEDENIFDDRRGLAGWQKKMEGSRALKLLDKETRRKKEGYQKCIKVSLLKDIYLLLAQLERHQFTLRCSAPLCLCRQSMMMISRTHNDGCSTTKKKCPNSFFLLSRILRRLSSSVDVIITSPMRDNVKLFQLTHLLSYLDYMFVHKKEESNTQPAIKAVFRLECRTQGMRRWKDKKTRACFEFAVGRVSGGGKLCFVCGNRQSSQDWGEQRDNNYRKRYLCFIICGDSALSPSFGFCLHFSRVELRTNDI